MLGKLLKYDLRAIYKPLSVFYGIVIVCTLLTQFFATINSDSFFIIFCKEFFKGAAIGFSIGAIINNAMNIWAYFRQNLYGDRGYLMHTLPISRNTLLASKFITAAITSFTTIALGIACVLIVNGSTSETLTIIRDNFVTSLQIALVFYLEIIFVIQCGISGTIIGHRFNYNKIALSIAFGFGFFIIFNVITTAILLFWGYADPSMAWIFGSVVPPNANIEDAMHTAFNFASVIYIVYIAGLYALNTHLLKQGIDLD